ncbi:MAG: hypothetical protein IKG03_01920 [Clostridiales bacterium]|nr:hypothetical protein [Clostridiales bacterium]
MGRKVIAVLVMLVLSIMVFTGCGEKGIEGTWVLAEELMADGTKITKKELEEIAISETYVIKDDTVTYTLEMDTLSKPVTIEYKLEDLGNNMYNFNIPNGRFTFATAVVDGNTMYYYVGEDDEAMKMIFKRK